MFRHTEITRTGYLTSENFHSVLFHCVVEAF